MFTIQKLTKYHTTSIKYNIGVLKIKQKKIMYLVLDILSTGRLRLVKTQSYKS